VSAVLAFAIGLSIMSSCAASEKSSTGRPVPHAESTAAMTNSPAGRPARRRESKPGDAGYCAPGTRYCGRIALAYTSSFDLCRYASPQSVAGKRDPTAAALAVGQDYEGAAFRQAAVDGCLTAFKAAGRLR
jgi:hypothetical protein